jgi:pyruvate kinase
VQTLEAIIRDAETIPSYEPHERRRSATHDDHAEAICEAACTLASAASSQAIVAITRGGSTARRLSARRPKAPIIAATEQHATARRLAIYWGVVPLHMTIGDNLDEASARVGAALIDRAFVAAGATAVFVSISADLTRSDANYLKIQRL